MSLIGFIYLISLLESIRCMVGLLFFLSTFFIVLFLFFGSVFASYFDLDISFIKSKRCKYIKYYLITMCVFVFLLLVIPKKATMYAMLAFGVGENFYKSEIAQKGIELLDLKLDELIVDAKKQNK